MWLTRIFIVSLLAGAALAGQVGASREGRAVHVLGSTPESVTVRVAYKSWGGEMEQCAGPNWGWDSLTWRLRQGEIAPRNEVFFEPQFRITNVISPDSARFAVRHGIFTAPDSFIVTPRWSETFSTVGIKDAQVWFRVRLVTPWPERPRTPVATTTLRGEVVDDSTGCGIYFCQVVVISTRCNAYTDTLGGFTLTDVPVGEVKAEACAGGYSQDVVVHVPRDTLVFRFPHDPRRRFARPCR